MRRTRPQSKVKVIFPHQVNQSRKRVATFIRPLVGTKIRSPSKNGAVMDSSSLADLSAGEPGHPGVPSLFTDPPPIRDNLVTETSIKQDAAVEECLPFLAGAIPGKTEFDYTPAGVSRLERADHIDFLKDHLESARYMAYDASRPWVLYWCLTGLSLLGEDATPYRQRFVSAAVCNRPGR